jgi:hypothetical protein
MFAQVANGGDLVSPILTTVLRSPPTMADDIKALWHRAVLRSPDSIPPQRVPSRGTRKRLGDKGAFPPKVGRTGGRPQRRRSASCE